MKTITALVTRGFDQQFDYNVLEALKPFGEDRHARLKRLEARLTSKNDYEFSFIVEGESSHWEMLLASIPSGRRDFAGSPLRTYLWLSGDSSDAQFAADVLTAALVGSSPKKHLGESSPLSKALDGILTSDIVDELGERGKDATRDPIIWSEEKFIPALRKELESMSTSKRDEVSVKVLEDAAKLFSGGVGRVSGEYSPFLDDPMKDEPNMTYHFTDGEVVRIDANGIETKVPPKRKAAPRPFVEPVPPPPPPKPKRRILIWVIVALVLGIVIGLRCCKKEEKPKQDNVSEITTTEMTIEK